jgi:membrane protease YdiL (CAAX protease family)
MTKDKAYKLAGLWAFFISFVHAGRKYFEYKNGGDPRMAEWKVLGLHFVATFGVFLLIGIVFVFLYFKFIKKK